LKISSHVVKSERFKDSPESTLKDLLDYLELSLKGSGLPFGFKDSKDHFSQEERISAILFMKQLASPETWTHLQEYLTL